MSNNKLQGEGDRESARRFNKASQEFVTSDQKYESAKETDHRGKHRHEYSHYQSSHFPFLQ